MKFDESKILTELETIKNKREELNNILTELKKNNNELKDCWETKTSESVFTSFEEMFYGEFQSQIEGLDEDITFLEATIENYKQNEAETNKIIDENIVV